MSYPGGKGNSFHKLINLMPPHDVYIEAFLGMGSVMRHKKPASVANIGIDCDAAALAMFREAGASSASASSTNTQLIQADALDWLRRSPLVRQASTLLYLDPPYLMTTRKQQRDLYRHEFGTEEEHRELVTVIRDLPCMVMISGYPSPLYSSVLAGWTSTTFQAMTRGGTWATEAIWMNYPTPIRLHDYQFLGEDFRERERIKRKISRWQGKLSNMSRLERQALLCALNECAPGS